MAGHERLHYAICASCQVEYFWGTIVQHQGQAGGHDVEKVAVWARRAIWVCATSLAALFAFLQLKNIPYGQVIENANPGYIREILLAFYYTCWVFGSSFDVNIQRYVFGADARQGAMPFFVGATLLIFLAVAAILVWVRDNDADFAVALAMFFLINLVGWWVITWRVTPLRDASIERFTNEQDYCSLLQVHLVGDYVLGSWQWWRLAVNGSLIGLGLLICMTSSFRDAAANSIHRLSPSISANAISALLPIGALFLFVAVSETWIWLARARVAAGVAAIEALRKDYDIVPRKHS